MRHLFRERKKKREVIRWSSNRTQENWNNGWKEKKERKRKSEWKDPAAVFLVIRTVIALLFLSSNWVSVGVLRDVQEIRAGEV